jgi:hypothetical protein
VVAHCERRCQTPERGGTPVALLPTSRVQERAWSHRESSRSITEKEVRAMEGVLLGAGVAAVLVGLGALVEAARPRRGGLGRRRSTSDPTEPEPKRS